MPDVNEIINSTHLGNNQNIAILKKEDRCKEVSNKKYKKNT